MSAFPARHPGRCHNDCGQWIDRGDLIRMTDAGAVHDDCTRFTMRHGHDRASELPPACPKCWLHHAGECDR